jgi:hypothetical protein
MIWRSWAAERREASAGPGRPDMLFRSFFPGQDTSLKRGNTPIDAARETAPDNLHRTQKVPIRERFGRF